MRIFKQMYTSPAGKKVPAKCYTVEVRDHRGKLRKFVGSPSKRAARRIGEHIELLAENKNAGWPPDAQLMQWLAQIPDNLRQRLARIGLIDRDRAAAAKPLTEHLDDYRQSIGGDTKHAKYTHSTLVRLFEACHFVFWSDIQASRLYNHLAKLKRDGEISQRTFNFHLKAARSFTRWMIQDQRVSESPIAHLRPIRITKREVERRALEPDELIKLLKTTAAGPKRYGMGGYERYLLYRFAAETGLRANECRSLRVGSFDFEALTVTVEAGSSKRKRQDVQVLKPETAEQAKEFFARKTPQAKAFGGSYKHLTDRTGEMLQADLADAGLPYVDEAGRQFDFHSLRHQTGSMLARYGVHPADAMQHMRHSSMDLTLKFYTHLRRGGQVETAAKLPDLSLPTAEEKGANQA